VKRAVVSIGVNRAGSMPGLVAAAKGARQFDRWARTQQCDATLLVDDEGAPVVLRDVSRAVRGYVDAGIYSQLIVYFSGHGILTAPDTEYWLLSDAPEDGNEAVNLRLSVANARNSGIPHVVFVSDACRSNAEKPPLSGVSGGVIFPNGPFVPQRAEVDVYYATLPGDPAYELPEAQSTKAYNGVFTECLLKAVEAPGTDLVDTLADEVPPLSVVSSRKLKPHLESTVPVVAGAVDVRVRQKPDLRVETALPKFFAVVDRGSIDRGLGVSPAGAGAPPRTMERAIAAMRHAVDAPLLAPAGDLALAAQLGLTDEVQRLADTRGRGGFETKTGFSIYGSRSVRVDARGWTSDPPFEEAGDPGALHVRLRPDGPTPSGTSAVLAFDGGTGTVLAILPEFVGVVVVRDGRVTSVNYVPARHTPRYDAYESRAAELQRMKALATIAARNGRFVVDDATSATQLADRIRLVKGIDPTLGLYAAYAYAQAGRDDEVVSVLRAMRDEVTLVPFDVALLASRGPAASLDAAVLAPFAPMLAQGWALLVPEDPLFHPVHGALRPHLLPSLWTTFSDAGVVVARDAVASGVVR
jgi:hypothetical protein